MSATPSLVSARGQASEPPSRPPTAARRVRGPPIEIRPSQVHELKLQTQQMQQQTLHLRTQLKRLESQIHSRSSVINQKFDPTREHPHVSPTIHASTIPNLQRNIESAQNTLATLKEQIEDLEADDRMSAIDELEEELKFAFCECARLSRGLHGKQAAAANYARELQEIEFRGSARHQGDLRSLVREVRAGNAALRQKSSAFLLKIEKLNIEDEIAGAQAGGRPAHEVIEDAEVEQAQLSERVNLLAEQMHEEANRHARKIARLGELIQTMKDKIAAKLEQDTESERKQ
jgi:hypothetical protein